MQTAYRLLFFALCVAWSSVSAQLIITSPNGGEVLTPGSTFTVQWTGVSAATKVTLEYSTDAGTQWNPVATKVAGLSYNWVVPNTISTTCLLRATITNQIVSEDSILTDNTAYNGLAYPSEMLWDPTSKTIGFGGANRVFRVSDLATIFDDNISNDPTIAFSPDGQTIILRRATGADMFDIPTGAFKRHFDFGLTFDVAWKATDPNNFFGIGNHTVLFDTAIAPLGIDTLNTSRWSYSISHDLSLLSNRYVMSFASGVNEAIIFDLTTLDSLYVLDAGDDCNDVQMSKDGMLVATFGKSGLIKIWNTITGALISTFNTPNIHSYVHNWAADNRHLAISTYGDSIMVWDAQTGTLSQTLHCVGGTPSNLSYRPNDGKYLMAEGGGRLYIFDGVTGTLLQNWDHWTTLPVGGGDNGVQWSPDGTMIAMRDAYAKFAIFYVVEQAGAQDQSDNAWTISAGIAQTFPIRIGIDSAFAGEIVYLPVILNDAPSLIAQGATSVRVNCSYNTTMLEPLPDPNTNRDVAGRVDFAVTLTPSMDTVIGTLPFRAGLGNAVSAIMNIVSASTNSPTVQLAPTNGLFTLRGVCFEGGARLMNPSGIPSINIPNPFASGYALPIELTTIEAGRTKLYLSDMLGRTAKEYLNDILAPGIRKLTLDLVGIANGKYLIVLETPTKHITRTIEVAR